jgi:hypothetical protein
MKQQKNNAEKKSKKATENWMTPKEAAEKLGINFSIENTYAFKQNKAKEKTKWN